MATDRTERCSVYRSLSKMCAVVRAGLQLLHTAWAASRDGLAGGGPLYADAEWDGVRERLLEGLRAVHLVCTAGLVKEAAELDEGMATMTEACSLAAVRFTVTCGWTNHDWGCALAAVRFTDNCGDLLLRACDLIPSL